MSSRILWNLVLVIPAIFQAGCLASNVNLISYTGNYNPEIRTVRTGLKAYYAGLERSSDLRSLPATDFSAAFKGYLKVFDAFEMVNDKADSDIIISGQCSWYSQRNAAGYVTLDIFLGLFYLGAGFFLGIPWQWEDGEAYLELNISDTRTGKPLGSFLRKSTKRVHAGLYYGHNKSAAGENANIVMGGVLRDLSQKINDIASKHASYKSLPATEEYQNRFRKKPETMSVSPTPMWRQQQQVKPPQIVSSPVNKMIVAIFNIEDASRIFKPESLDQLTDYLCSKMASGAGFRVVPREQLRLRLVEEKRESHKECYDDVCQIEMGKALSAEMSLSTKIIMIGSQCALMSILYDLRTETSTSSSTVRTECAEEKMMDAIDKLVNDFANGAR